MEIFRTLTLALGIIMIVAGCAPAIKSPAHTGYPYDVIPEFDKPPVEVYVATPDYPPQAQAEKIEGYVIIRAFVDEVGRILTAEAIKCSRHGYGFERAAVDAAYRCRYSPAENKGLKVGVWISYRVNFVLDL